MCIWCEDPERRAELDQAIKDGKVWSIRMENGHIVGMEPFWWRVVLPKPEEPPKTFESADNN